MFVLMLDMIIWYTNLGLLKAKSVFDKLLKLLYILIQLEYAALDAIVLIHIFRHVRNHSKTADADGRERIEWKSYIVSEDS